MQTRGGTPSDNPGQDDEAFELGQQVRKLSEKRPPLLSACRKGKNDFVPRLLFDVGGADELGRSGLPLSGLPLAGASRKPRGASLFPWFR
jgi:hypothetical protein